MPTILANDIHNRSVEPRHLGLSVANDFAGALTLGMPVYVSGVVTDSTSKFFGMLKVNKADSNATFPANIATHIVIETIAQNGAGRVARAATLYNVDTSAWASVGDPVYVSTTAGLWSQTAPSGTDANVQRCGYVSVKSSTVGTMVLDVSAAPIQGASTATLLAADNTWSGTNTYNDAVAGIKMLDNSPFVIGTGSDDTIAHEGTYTLWTHNTGDLVIDVTGVTEQLAFRCGTDTLLTGVEIRNNSDYAFVQINPISATAGRVQLSDNTRIYFGDGQDIGILWDATRLTVAQSNPNSEIRWGVDGAGIDQMFYTDTAGAYFQIDQSADKLILGGVAKIQLQTIAAATATPIPVTHSGSFPITTAAAETNTLPDPTFLGQTISMFVDTYAVGDRVVTAASRINQTGNTIMTFGASADFIKLEAITIAGALKWQIIYNEGVALS